RRAWAEGKIHLASATLELLRQKAMPKGDVLCVAQIAGIAAAKRTADLIPLCHPLTLDKIDVQIEITDEDVVARSTVHCHGRTGVEMEALAAVSVALLTIYDMCKAVDRDMRITDIHLVEKVKFDESEN
ncbi:MAG: cyclic pyranopterin monophosphate synthase MoaC, partial [Thermoguttaceae bacterium]